MAMVSGGNATKKTKRLTLAEVAAREGVSERTVDSWSRLGKRHGLDPRDVEECKQIRRLAGSAPGSGAGTSAYVVDRAANGDLVVQLENARAMTQSAFAAFEKEKDGSEQARLKRSWETAVEAQMRIERAVAELQRSDLLHVDDVRSAFHSAWSQLRARLEAGGKVLLPALAGENEVGRDLVYSKWVNEMLEGIRNDAERRIDSV